MHLAAMGRGQRLKSEATSAAAARTELRRVHVPKMYSAPLVHRHISASYSVVGSSCCSASALGSSAAPTHQIYPARVASFSPALERWVAVRKHLRWVTNHKLNQP